MYTHTPKVVRLFEEHGEWFIDGFDPITEGYTDPCWSYDSRAEALKNIGEFVIEYPEHYLFTWDWPTDQEYQVGDPVFLTECHVSGTVVGITDEGLFLVDIADTGTYETYSAEFLTAHRAAHWVAHTKTPEDGRAPWEDSYQAYGHGGL